MVTFYKKISLDARNSSKIKDTRLKFSFYEKTLFFYKNTLVNNFLLLLISKNAFNKGTIRLVLKNEVFKEKKSSLRCFLLRLKKRIKNEVYLLRWVRILLITLLLVEV